MCWRISMRLGDSRSSMRLLIRPACCRMMARNFSRAASSLAAGPSRVSMNPTRDVSGVRSSWLTLAMKSEPELLCPLVRGEALQRQDEQAIVPGQHRNVSTMPGLVGHCLMQLTACALPVCRAVSIAVSSAGLRSATVSSAPGVNAGNSLAAGPFRCTTTARRSTMIAGSGNASAKPAKDREAVFRRHSISHDGLHSGSGNDPPSAALATKAAGMHALQGGPHGRRTGKLRSSEIPNCPNG